GISRYWSDVLPVRPALDASCFFFAYSTSPITPTRPPRFPPNQMPPSNPVLVLKQPSQEAALYEVNSGPNFTPLPAPEPAGPPPPGGGACSTTPAVRNELGPVPAALAFPPRISPSLL